MRRMRSRLRHATAVGLAAVLLSLASCSGSSALPPTPPTAPAASAAADAEPEASPTAVASAEPVAAPPKAPQKTCPSIGAMPPEDGGSWRALVSPRACWTLTNFKGGKANAADTVVIETYDARRVGDGDVAKLRYTRATSEGESDLNGNELLPAQVAVTDKGVYFFDRRADDGAIGQAMKKAPTHAEPPKPMDPDKKTGWKFLRVKNTPHGEVVCIGQELPKSEAKCGDACDGTVCVSAKAGIVVLEGTASPTGDVFVREGYR
jgi:hypothetical protein